MDGDVMNILVRTILRALHHSILTLELALERFELFLTARRHVVDEVIARRMDARNESIGKQIAAIDKARVEPISKNQVKRLLRQRANLLNELATATFSVPRSQLKVAEKLDVERHIEVYRLEGLIRQLEWKYKILRDLVGISGTDNGFGRMSVKFDWVDETCDPPRITSHPDHPNVHLAYIVTDPDRPGCMVVNKDRFEALRGMQVARAEWDRNHVRN